MAVPAPAATIPITFKEQHNPKKIENVFGVEKIKASFELQKAKLLENLRIADDSVFTVSKSTLNAMLNAMVGAEDKAGRGKYAGRFKELVISQTGELDGPKGTVEIDLSKLRREYLDFDKDPGAVDRCSSYMIRVNAAKQ